MLTKSDIKLINSLKRKSKRRESRLFVAEGTKIVKELLNSRFKVHKVYSVNDEVSHDYLIKVTEKELQKITHLSTPNKVLALVEIPVFENIVNPNSTTLVIDRVNDPGNLGTIIRTADWFGIRNIVCSTDSVDCFNSKVIMSTMGSIFRVNITYQSLSDFLLSCDVPIYGALLEGKSIYNTKFSSPSIILMGSESHGISKELIPLVSNPTTIPGVGNAESLNLGISTAIFCSEYFRSLQF